MEFKENSNGNLVATTPSGSTLVIYRVKDDYGVRTDRWSWIATRTDGVKKYANESYSTLLDAERAINSTLRIAEEVKPIRPETRFEYTDLCL